MQVAGLAVSLAVSLAGCNDLRDFHGAWRGARVGDAPVLRVGVAPRTTATLVVDALDTHGLSGELSVDGLVTSAPFVSLAGAEADVLSGMSFNGAPLRVYLAFLALPDGGGEALAVIALYQDHRMEVRLLRGGGQPIYAIFALTQIP